MSRSRLTAVLALLILVCVVSLGLDAPKVFFLVRGYSPLPLDYVARLHMLEGWNSGKGDGLNCSGYICAAHSSPFRPSYAIFENSRHDMTLLAEVASISAIDESKLLPGDVAAFRGPSWHLNHGHEGSHVAAYLGNGLWSAGDGRAFKGIVVTFRLSEVVSTDGWYQGRVRLYRWNESPKFSLTVAASNLGHDDDSPEVR